MNIPDVELYDDLQRRQVSDIILTRVRNMWFENYEANLDLVMKWGGLQKMADDTGPLTRAVVVGAGFTVSRNITELRGIKAPVIACDKIASTVANFTRPLAVTALNTQGTDVCKWLADFNASMLANWGETDLKNTYLVVPVTVNPQVFEVWGGKVAFVNPSNTCDELCQQVYRDSGIDPTVRGDNVGYFSVILAVTLGAKEVAMIGMPYSYATRQEVMDITAGEHAVELKDVNKEYVYTSLDWIEARREFVNFCRDVRQQCGVNFVNCSEGGIVYQPGVIRACRLSIWKAHL
jgi:hypothetical protein